MTKRLKQFMWFFAVVVITYTGTHFVDESFIASRVERRLITLDAENAQVKSILFDVKQQQLSGLTYRTSNQAKLKHIEDMLETLTKKNKAEK